MASWYGDKYRGKRTASGERFDPMALTAAHPSLPFGALVRVTNPMDGRSVVVRVNDRGPAGGRLGIDLSYAAALAVGIARAGIGPVLLAPVAEAQLAEFRDGPAQRGLAQTWWRVDDDGTLMQPHGDPQ